MNSHIAPDHPCARSSPLLASGFPAIFGSRSSLKRPLPSCTLSRNRPSHLMGKLVFLSHVLVEVVFPEAGGRAANSALTPPSWRGQTPCLANMLGGSFPIHPMKPPAVLDPRFPRGGGSM